MPVTDQMKDYLRSKFYSNKSDCTIIQGKGAGRVDQSPSTRLGKALGVTKFVAAVVAPTAAVAIYAFSVSEKLEGPLTADAWVAAHQETFDSPEALAQVAGARGPHHDEGIEEALEEATRLTPAQVASLANEQGWSGSAIETIMEQHQIHKVSGQFVADPSALHANTPVLDQLVELIQQGAKMLEISQARFAGTIGPALDQFIVVADSYAAADPESRSAIFGPKLHESIYVGTDDATVVVEFDIKRGKVGVRDISLFLDQVMDRMVRRPSLDAHQVSKDGEVMPQYQEWFAEDLSSTVMARIIGNMDISNRLATFASDQGGEVETADIDEGFAPGR